MLPYLSEHHGDPGRLHSEGRLTRVALENAREQVADFLGARPREVVFTSGGTEAIVAAHWWLEVGAHVVTTAVEHSAVRETLARTGADTSVIGVDRFGRYDAAEVLAAIRPETRLISVQLANHEVGTVQPAAEVCATASERGVVVHVDACAAIGQVSLSFAAIGADLCSVTAHKLGGPQGAGALLVRRGLRIPPLLVGGAQERARRAGIENVAAMVGFGAACNACDVTAEASRSRALVARAAAAALAVDGVTRFGDASPDGSLPNLLCVGVDGVEAEPILLGLDQRGVAVHSGSACSSETLEPSPVLEAMGVDAQHSLRVSLGWSSSDADIDAFVAAFPDVVSKLRSLRA
jgi:cysteine desulfurase